MAAFELFGTPPEIAAAVGLPAGAAAEDDGLAAPLEGCAGRLVESMEAIGTEFPGFQANEVAFEFFAARRVYADPAGLLSLLADVGRVRTVSDVCSAADTAAAVADELRRERPRRAGDLWERWPSFERPSELLSVY